MTTQKRTEQHRATTLHQEFYYTPLKLQDLQTQLTEILQKTPPVPAADVDNDDGRSRQNNSKHPPPPIQQQRTTATTTTAEAIPVVASIPFVRMQLLLVRMQGRLARMGRQSPLRIAPKKYLYLLC
jgi:hypothetical protein